VPISKDMSSHAPLLSRRTLLRGAATTAFTSTAAVVAAPGTAQAGSSVPYLGADPAEGFVRAVGINTHFNFGTSVYSETSRVLEALDDLGVRHIRDRVTHTSGTRRGFAEFARSGGRVEGICGALGDSESMRSVVRGVLDAYSDPHRVFSALEGINEPNNDGVPWVEETRGKLLALRRQRNRHDLHRIPIVAPALARVNSGGVEGATTEEQSARLGDLSDVVDVGNVHVYPRMQTPSGDIDRFLAYQRAVCGRRPVHCTEAGWFTAMNYEGGSWPTPEDVVATYAPRLIAEHWLRGIRRVFLYELLDDYDPTGADRESNFGLFRVGGPDRGSTWTPKPHARALRNLLAIMADPGRSHDVGGLRVGVDGPDDLRRLLFAKRDGSRYLLLWRDVPCYDPASRTRLDVPARSVSLTFPVRRRVTLFRPTLQRAAVHGYTRSTQVRLPVAEDLVVARID
jgi:hypothetical protein